MLKSSVIETKAVRINFPIFSSSFIAKYSATNLTKPEVMPKLDKLAIEEKDRISDHTPSCFTPNSFNKYLYKKKYNIAVNATCIIADKAFNVIFFFIDINIMYR